MGFFSGKCCCCGKSILNKYAIMDYLSPKEAWLSRVIGITPSSKEKGMVLRGIYDGYGRIESIKGVIVAEPEDLLDGVGGWSVDLYHEECWKLAGEPMDFTGGSKNAPDQGFFIDQDVYRKAKPSAGKAKK